YIRNMTSDVIGIDLGTTHSCVAIYSKGKLEVLENDHGLRTTPSYVAFTQNEIIVGNEAKLNTCIDPSNTVSVFDTKRMIGLSFDDSCIQRDLKYWPFKVSNNSGKPMIK
ncbi:70 kDa heat shock protein C-like protein, partial [Leptotrombidium deliense]